MTAPAHACDAGHVFFPGVGAPLAADCALALASANVSPNHG